MVTLVSFHLVLECFHLLRRQGSVIPLSPSKEVPDVQLELRKLVNIVTCRFTKAGSQADQEVRTVREQVMLISESPAFRNLKRVGKPESFPSWKGRIEIIVF